MNLRMNLWMNLWIYLLSYPTFALVLTSPFPLHETEVMKMAEEKDTMNTSEQEQENII